MIVTGYDLYTLEIASQDHQVTSWGIGLYGRKERIDNKYLILKYIEFKTAIYIW